MPPPFPQAHRAKNLASSGGKGTKTGDMVLHIQKALPNARVMYVSATAAADVSDLGYMVRSLVITPRATWATWCGWACGAGALRSLVITPRAIWATWCG